MVSKSRVPVKIIGAALTIAVSLVILCKAFTSNATLGSYGILGIFLAALLSHLSIVARGFFLPAFLSLTELYNPIVLGLAAGLGGALGEVTAYCWGLGIRETLNNRGNSDPLPRWAEKYGFLLMLLFASSPLPDTPIVLLSGSLRLPLRKVVLIQVVGKTALYSAGAFLGGFIFMEIKSTFSDEIISSAIILIASTLLCILVSWRRSRDKILKILKRVIEPLYNWCFRK